MSAIRIYLENARLSIFQPCSDTSIDVKGWVATQNYYIDSDIEATKFTLRASNPEQLKAALANDVNRMTIAAFESAAGVLPDPAMPRSVAWGAIRAYYASFFAAHALMRLFGTCCSQLDYEHVNMVYRSALIFGKTGAIKSIDSGFYSVSIDANFETVVFEKLKDSHKDSWRTFRTLLDQVAEKIPESVSISKYKIEASALISDISDSISRANSTSGNWLSLMRNSINYRHSHGVWFPYTSKLNGPQMLDAASRKWLTYPSVDNLASDAGDVDAFMTTSTKVVALLRELIISGSELSTKINPSFKNGCLKLLNEVQASRNL